MQAQSPCLPRGGCGAGAAGGDPGGGAGRGAPQTASGRQRRLAGGRPCRTRGGRLTPAAERLHGEDAPPAQHAAAAGPTAPSRTAQLARAGPQRSRKGSGAGWGGGRGAGAGGGAARRGPARRRGHGGRALRPLGARSAGLPPGQPRASAAALRGAPRLGSRSGSERGVTAAPPSPVTRRVCLPAAEPRPAGGEWTGARKEMEPQAPRARRGRGAGGGALPRTPPALRPKL